MDWAPLAVAAGSSLLSGVIGMSAADDAADAAREAAKAQERVLLYTFEQGREDIAPWRLAGQEALARLMGTGGTRQEAMGALGDLALERDRIQAEINRLEAYKPAQQYITHRPYRIDSATGRPAEAVRVESPAWREYQAKLAPLQQRLAEINLQATQTGGTAGIGQDYPGLINLYPQAAPYPSLNVPGIQYPRFELAGGATTAGYQGAGANALYGGTTGQTAGQATGWQPPLNLEYAAPGTYPALRPELANAISPRGTKLFEGLTTGQVSPEQVLAMQTEGRLRSQNVTGAPVQAQPVLSFEDYEQSPSYQFQLDELTRLLERQAAGGNYYNTPRVLEELENRAAGLVSQDYENWFNRQMAQAALARQSALDVQNEAYRNALWQLQQYQGERGQNIEDWMNQWNALMGLSAAGQGAAAQQAGQQAQLGQGLGQNALYSGLAQGQAAMNQAAALTGALSSGTDALLTYLASRPQTQPQPQPQPQPQYPYYDPYFRYR